MKQKRKKNETHLKFELNKMARQCSQFPREAATERGRNMRAIEGGIKCGGSWDIVSAAC